jgi:hypothetical protein
MFAAVKNSLLMNKQQVAFVAEETEVKNVEKYNKKV